MSEPAQTIHRNKGTVQGSQATLLGGTLAVLTLSLAITILLGRSLPPQDFGFFALVSTLLALGRDIMDLGMGNVATRETVAAPEREKTIIEGLLGWRALLGAVLALACIAMALGHENGRQRWALCAAAAVIAFMYLNGVLPAFQVRQAWKAPTLLAVGTQGLLLAGCAGLLFLRARGPSFALLIVLREACVIVGNRFLASRVLGFTPRPRLFNREIWAFLRKLLTLGLAVLFYHLYMRGGMFLVWLMRPAEEAGAFAAAFRPVQPLLALPWVLMVPLVPELSRLAIADRPRFARLVMGTCRLAAGIGAIGGAAACVLAPHLIELLYGSKYGAGDLSAVVALQWLALAFCFAWLTPVFATALLADGQEKSLLGLSVTVFALNLGANILLLPRHPFFFAAAIAALTEVSFCLGASLILKAREKSLRPDLPLLWALTPAALLFAALHLIPGSCLIRVALGGCLSGLALLALMTSPMAASYRREFSSVTR